MQIAKETLKELEFQKILEEIAPFCYSDKAKKLALHIKPLPREGVKRVLNITNEYLSSFSNETIIPFGEYDIIEDELTLLTIEDSVLEAKSFHKIRNLSTLINGLIKHFNKYKEIFPTLLESISHIEPTKEIIDLVNTTFNRFGEVKDDATPTLHEIRKKMQVLRKEIQENFDKSLTHYSQIGILNEIRESVVENYRVLAVKSEYKKQVKGRVLGFSKTNSICFIIPESVIKHNTDLLQVESQEKKEIDKILLTLTNQIAEFYPLLEDYQKYVYTIDVIQAKAKYADLIKAILPNIVLEPMVEVTEAYHPILLLNNNKEKKHTIPQDIELNADTRIICISGPNAGGKSITLKTIGLCQLMIQSGILVPVHPKSTLGYFDKILTDIGDNQSIENHLSTYSSRLKKMQQIIKQADGETLLLIDEFGTGSDPELGGALAEALLEHFYKQASYGIITTHYTNIKLRVQELPHTINAAMLFNEKTLSPLYKLEVGQVGSSFTFEVAEKNKIPTYIIQSAKDKVAHDTLNLDNTIVNLQKERNQVEKLKGDLHNTLSSSSEKKQELSDVVNSYKQKLVNFQKIYEEESKLYQLGLKLEKFIEAYSSGKARKDITKDFIKILEQEKYKDQATSEREKVLLQKQRKKIKDEIKEQEIPTIIEQTKEEEKQKIPVRVALWQKQNRKVRIKGSSSSATIDKIEGENVLLNYGKFTTKTSIYDIEMI